MSGYGERLGALREEYRAALLPLVLDGRLADLRSVAAEIRERAGISDQEWSEMSIPERERVIRADRRGSRRRDK